MLDLTKWKLPEDDEWLNERLAFEDRLENQLSTPRESGRLHPLLLPLRASLEASAKQTRERVLEYERRQKLPRRKGEPNTDALTYGFPYANGGVLACSKGTRPPLRVTEKTYKRALRVAQSIIVGAEKRKITIGFEQEGRFQLQLDGATLWWALRERMESEVRTHTIYGYESSRRVSIPTGRLMLVVFLGPGGWRERKFNDDEAGNFDDLGTRVFGALYRNVIDHRCELRAKEHAAKRRTEVQQRMAEIEAEREKAAAIQKERERREQEEASRVGQLVAEATAWEQAELVRRYVANIPEPVNAAWRTWALEAAARLDRRAERQDATGQ